MRVLRCGVGCVFAFVNCALAQQWTEQDVLRQFLDQNPIQREAQARRAVAAAETSGRTLWANPTMGVSREGAGRTEFYQASQALPLSGRFALLRQAGLAQAAVLQAEGEAQLWMARCQLRAAFYRTLAIQQRKDIWARAEQDLARILTILQAREREGEGSKLDRLRAEREHVDLRSARQALDAELALSRGEMLAFLPSGAKLPELIGRLEPAEAPAIETLPGVANRLRADLEAERQRMEQLRKEQAAARRLWVPEPLIQAGVKRADVAGSVTATGPVVGVAVPIPLFNKGQTEVARYGAEYERVAARVEQMSRRIHAGVTAAWQALRLATQTRNAYAEAQIPGTREMVRIATLAYQEGEIQILQLLDAFRLERDAQLRVLELTHIAKQAQIHLEAQLGQEFKQ